MTARRTQDAGLARYERMFGRRDHADHKKLELDRASLPNPERYLIDNDLIEKIYGDWAAILCPVHKGGNERHPSMNVSLIDGHFRCHGCDARGGDILALHRLRTGLAFREAVLHLGGRFK